VKCYRVRKNKSQWEQRLAARRLVAPKTLKTVPTRSEEY
jgi:hypothetical protein